MDRPQQGGAASGLRAYYVAVGSAEAKLETLVELLEALNRDSSAKLAVAVACSSRDSLDAVVAALAHRGGFNLAVLHSDLELHDMEQQVLQLKRALQAQAPTGVHAEQPAQAQHQPQPQQAVVQHHHQQQALVQQQQALVQQHQHQQPPQPPILIEQDPRCIALVTTDVCLKVLHKDLLPLGPGLLVQYDLPSTKEVLQRRLACVFGSSKERSRKGGSRLVVIDFLAAGQLAAFRARERMTTLAVQEMPVHVPDVFA